MFNLSEIALNSLVVHKVGNKLQNEPLGYSRSAIEIDDDEIKALLMKYFTSPFKTDAFFYFDDSEKLEANFVYNAVTQIFENPSELYTQSKFLAQHLYEVSNHPNIKTGEFYVCYFSDCLLDGEVTDAVGIFKSESKDTYLKVYHKNENYEIDYENGINIRKLDKGALIFNTEKDIGYKVLSIDKTNNNEALYWKEDFLKLQQRSDSFYHTQNYLNMCKGFVEDVFNSDNNVDRADQIVMLNKSMEYFDKKENFDEYEFQNEVMQQPEIIEAFNDYKGNFLAENNVEPENAFEISKSAAKTNKKFFKSILKLDKNFHVYIHGNRDFVERGFDEQRHMNYYKLYFHNEE